MGDYLASKYFEKMSFRAGVHFESGKLCVLNQTTGDNEILNDFGIHRLEMYHSDEKGIRIPLWDIR